MIEKLTGAGILKDTRIKTLEFELQDIMSKKLKTDDERAKFESKFNEYLIEVISNQKCFDDELKLKLQINHDLVA